MGKLLTGDASEDFCNLVAYGKSGTGKTTLGVTAPDPFFLLSERQGYQSIRDAARMLGKPMPPVLYLESLEDIRSCMRALKGNTSEPIAVALREVLCERKDGKLVKDKEVEKQIAALPYLKPKTVVADSITDFCVLVSEDILASMKFPKSKTDGMEVKPDRYWGLLRDRSERMLREFRDLPYHVLFLALLDDRTIGEGDERSRVVGPDTPMRKIPTTLVAASNACCITFVEQQGKRVEGSNGSDEFKFDYHHKVRFAGPSYMTLKPIRPLDDVEQPNMTNWLHRISKHAATEVAATKKGA